ncbi:hypothetical protein FBUS_08306 [Fasciolopsis buskii]|uniref:NHR domain-containing protein n=1 Tax=Fasciolopsis buskii TaxID=27845 RepID=A0A8E0VLA5_9TREM|nr:hypothetical protein FBUS_08306 [Fasciolopsis buski]
MDSLFFDGLNKGRYVELTSNGTKARRQLGFCDGVVVSATHIRPGELVAVEILETQPGWSGDLRVGFTLLPDEALHPLPRFAIPELVTRGDSWIFPVGNAASLLASHRRRAFWHRQQQQQKRHQNRPSRNAHIVAANSRMGHSLPERINFRLNDEQSSILRRFPSIPISPCSCCLNTPFGRVALKRLLPTDGAYLRPPDVEKGTIVAIYYELEACSSTHSNPCSSSAAYLNWLPSPTYEENRMVSGVACEMNVERGCSMPIVSPARAASQARPTQPPEDLNSNPLCFQFVFHIVINGIDLITISEQVTLREEQLSPISTQSVRSTSSLVTDSAAAFDPTRNSMILYAPKMRAVLDVYGQTKAVRLVPLHQEPVPRLSRLSSCAILRQIVRTQAPKASALNYVNTSQQPTTSKFSDRSTLPELDTQMSFKRAKSSVFESDGNTTSPFLSMDDGHPIWSSRSTLGHLPNSQRCKELIGNLDQLPLPVSVRRDLQRDVCAIVWRELVG